MESPSTNSKIQLANDINSAFLEPLQSYPKLSPSSKIEVTNHRIPKVSIESVERKLRTIKESKAPGPDEIPNWFLKTFSHLLAEPVCYLINSSFQKNKFYLLYGKRPISSLYQKIRPSKNVIKIYGRFLSRLLYRKSLKSMLYKNT